MNSNVFTNDDENEITTRIDLVDNPKNKMCHVCNNKKLNIQMLSCGNDPECTYKVCTNCMSLQLNKMFLPYDLSWQGKDNQEIVISENDDRGGFSWACPSCNTNNVLTEIQLMYCADAKTIRNNALDILKPSINL